MYKVFLSIVTIVIIFVLVFLIYVYANIRFDIDKIVNYKPLLTTRFFDRNGKLVANIFSKQDRIYVKYDDIPPRVIEALIAIEDTTFFEHHGINVDAIFRAIIKDIRHGKMVEGASTLTQQLVKTMALTRDKKLMRKIKEVLLSLRLETVLSKEQILERYLNQVYFGHGYYGIRTASLGYFKKELSQLSLKEIAMLVGLPRAPSFYDPTRNLKFSLTRGNQVIARMYKLGWISKEEYIKSLQEVPVVYNQTLALNKAPYAVDFAIAKLKGNVDDVKKGGYDIYLSIDLNAQKLARKSLEYGYNRIKARDKNVDDNQSMTKTLNGAMVTIKNHTGEILSLVGGVDYAKSSFNRAYQSERQPGSTAKPFIYQVALNLGYSTATSLMDLPRIYHYNTDDENKTWEPQNFEKNFKGIMSLRNALTYSRNLAAINLVSDIGIDIVYNKLKFFGFDNIPYDLTMTLGSFSISPLKMTQMYTIFSNKGVEVEPYIIKKIVNRYGQVMHMGTKDRYITSKGQAYLITSILENVVTNGTGRLSRVRGLQSAGKSGTTNENKDAWFCAYTPTMESVIWFGNDDDTPMRKTETGGRSSGAVFKYFYTRYLKLHPELKRRFSIPKSVKSSFVNGKKEYYTNISPLPKTKIGKKENMKLIF